jgi:hypothetical protein
VHIAEKGLERLATSQKTTIVIERKPDGKMRAASGSWDGEKVFLKDQVLEVRHAIADTRLHGSQNQGTGRVGPHRSRRHDPYGPGNAASDLRTRLRL